jgi:dCTP deaminase
MAFWTSQDLEERLPELISDFAAERVDCNAYTLRIGDEYYVSPTDQALDPQSVTICKRAMGEAFTIPPGQFAFLVTAETVGIPNNAMAFISMKASIKFRGLVNVSGFHVDPGYRGKLIFAVFNAGPVVIHLKCGQECFLIWFASLTADSKKNKNQSGSHSLSTTIINSVAGEVQSLDGLHSKLKEVEKRLTERVAKVEPEYSRYIAILTVAASLVLVVLGFVIRDRALLSPPVQSAVTATAINKPTEMAIPTSQPLAVDSAGKKVMPATPHN